MKRIQHGFTLIELMIVVAIIGILAAVAIPAYQDYIARAQVSEAVNLIGGGKTSLAEYYADKGTWPSTPTAVMGNTAGKYTGSISFNAVTGGTLALVAKMKSTGINAAITGKTVALATTDGGKTWSCTLSSTFATSPTLDSKYVPGACR